MDVFLEAYEEAPGQVILDLDSTDDLIHGHQGDDSFTRTMETTAICCCTYSATTFCCARG